MVQPVVGSPWGASGRRSAIATKRVGGSVGRDRRRIPKWRWGPVLLPVDALSSRCWPTVTRSPIRENTLQDVITKLESDLILTVTGLTVDDFHLLVRLKVFNNEQMTQALFAFRRYEDSSLAHTGIDSHPGLTHYGLYDTVVALEE